MSRNKREGQYHGFAKRHVRTREYNKVNSWLAFRTYSEKKRRSSSHER